MPFRAFFSIAQHGYGQTKITKFSTSFSHSGNQYFRFADFTFTPLNSDLAQVIILAHLFFFFKVAVLFVPCFLVFLFGFGDGPAFLFDENRRIPMLLVVFSFENLNRQSEIPYGSENIYTDTVKRRTRFFGVAAIFRNPFGALFA